MPTRTFNIKATTVQPGVPTVFGPMNVQHNVTDADILVDRTVAGGLNQLTADTTVDVAMEISPDGTTWAFDTGADWVGGQYTDRDGPVNTVHIGVTGLDDPNANFLRGVVTVGGPSPVVLAGTITVTG